MAYSWYSSISIAIEKSLSPRLFLFFSEFLTDLVTYRLTNTAYTSIHLPCYYQSDFFLKLKLDHDIHSWKLLIVDWYLWWIQVCLDLTLVFLSIFTYSLSPGCSLFTHGMKHFFVSVCCSSLCLECSLLALYHKRLNRIKSLELSLLFTWQNQISEKWNHLPKDTEPVSGRSECKSWFSDIKVSLKVLDLLCAIRSYQIYLSKKIHDMFWIIKVQKLKNIYLLWKPFCLLLFKVSMCTFNFVKNQWEKKRLTK